MFTSHNQISRPGHGQQVTTSDVPTPTFGPNKSHLAQGHWKITGEEGGTILKPKPATSKLNLIETDAATQRLATVLTVCSTSSSIVACVLVCACPKGPKD